MATRETLPEKVSLTDYFALVEALLDIGPEQLDGALCAALLQLKTMRGYSEASNYVRTASHR